MKITAKRKTIIGYIFASILWLLGMLTLIFNILGLWTPWHLAGFGFIFCLPITAIFQISAIVSSYDEKNKKTIIMNFVSLALSIVVTLFTMSVSSTWFW